MIGIHAIGINTEKECLTKVRLLRYIVNIREKRRWKDAAYFLLRTSEHSMRTQDTKVSGFCVLDRNRHSDISVNISHVGSVKP